MPKLNYSNVRSAIEKGGSIRRAAEILGVKSPSVQWWLARNGYSVEKRAKLVPIRANYELTEKGIAMVTEITTEGEE